MAKKNGKGVSLLPTPSFSDLEPFGRNVSRLFDMPMFRWDNRPMNQLPSVDMVDEGDRIRIKADLPGIEKENVKLNVERNAVTIQASSKSSEERKGKNYYYRERSASGYYRSIPLPTEVEASSAKAKFSNGTLELTINKKGHSSKSVRID